MASILLDTLHPIQKPVARNTIDYSIKITSYETKAQADDTDEKFDDYKKTEKDFPKPKILEDKAESKSDNKIKDEGNNAFFNNAYNNYLKIIKKEKDEKLKLKKPIKSESNVIYRAKVKIGKKKTQIFIVKGILCDNEIKNSFKTSEVKKGDKIICRIGQNDEYIELDNIEKVNDEYIF